MNRKEREIKRGDIYYADLSPVIGSEQGGRRPIIVIQNDCGNLHSPTIIIAATTGQKNKPQLPTHTTIFPEHTSDINSKGLSKETIVLLEQIRTIDRLRLENYIGRLDDKAMQKLDIALSVSVGLDYLLKK